MNEALPQPYHFTEHAIRQMDRRRIAVAAVQATVRYGRAAWTRGARIFAIGQREVARWRARGITLQQFEGIHVVTTADGAVLTVYRNRDLRGLRRGNRPRRWRSA